jgi:hypothetical protein
MISETARRFGGTYHLQHKKNEESGCSFKLIVPPTSNGLLLGFLLDQEDRGNIFLRKVWVSPSYTA